MAALTIILGVLLSVLNTVIAGRTLWKDWKQRQDKPHPLDAAVRDISAALRERDATLRQLDDAIKQTEAARRRLEFE
jgi:hypothetical protein